MGRLTHHAARLKVHARKLAAMTVREINPCDAAELNRIDDELRRAQEAIDDMRYEIATALEEQTAIDDCDRGYIDAMLSLIRRPK